MSLFSSIKHAVHSVGLDKVAKGALDTALAGAKMSNPIGQAETAAKALTKGPGKAVSEHMHKLEGRAQSALHMGGGAAESAAKAALHQTAKGKGHGVQEHAGKAAHEASAKGKNHSPMQLLAGAIGHGPHVPGKLAAVQEHGKKAAGGIGHQLAGASHGLFDALSGMTSQISHTNLGKTLLSAEAARKRG